MQYLSYALRFVPLVIMGLLTLGTYWMVQMNTPDASNAVIKKHVPDYTVKNIKMTTLDVDGQTKYRVVGSNLIHFEDDTGYEMKQPVARRFNIDKPPTTVKADMGYMDNNMSILELVNNATLNRPAQPATSDQKGSARLFMSSSKFVIFLNDDIVKTDRPVILEQGLSIMQSQDGAIFDNVTQKLTMLGQVRGRIESESKGK